MERLREPSIAVNQTNASEPEFPVLSPSICEEVILTLAFGHEPLFTREEFSHVNGVNPRLEPLGQVVPLTVGFDTLVNKTTVAVQGVAVHSEE